MTVIRPPCLPPPAMPPVFHNIVGRAFTPAGEVCGGPEGHWQGKVRHPSVGWRRRRGALPLCGGDILQTPPGPCPASAGDDLHVRSRSRHFFALRNAACVRQCLHCPGSLAAAQAPMRRARSPALHCGRERAATDERLLSARPAGGPMQASAPTQRGDTPRPSSTRHARRPPAMPPVCHNIVGRAFTPAGEVCGGPEGHWQGKVRHPSVGWRRHYRFAVPASRCVC